jgi:hypothetical protein
MEEGGEGCLWCGCGSGNFSGRRGTGIVCYAADVERSGGSIVRESLHLRQSLYHTSTIVL